MVNRRLFNQVLPASLVIPGGLAGCGLGPGESAYQKSVRQTWRLGPLQGLRGADLGMELVRHATLPPRCAGPCRPCSSETCLRASKLPQEPRPCVLRSRLC